MLDPTSHYGLQFHEAAKQLPLPWVKSAISFDTILQLLLICLLLHTFPKVPAMPGSAFLRMFHGYFADTVVPLSYSILKKRLYLLPFFWQANDRNDPVRLPRLALRHWQYLPLLTQSEQSEQDLMFQ